MGRMNGKVVIVTGAGSGIGKATAKRLAMEGAKVVLTDLQTDKLEAAINEIAALQGDVIAVTHNVAEEEGWVSVLEKAESVFGTVNVLVNSAGIRGKTDTADEWERVLKINLTGSYLGMKHVVPGMKRYGGGSIINIASLASIGGGGFNSYTASKGGLRAISRAAAVDFAKDNIRVNSIYPGLIITPMTEGILNHEQTKKYFEDRTPLPRFGTADDIAYGVLYLASDEASYVTGSELVIDGGTTAS
ncbi:2,5-dichloro-2,5-cyclohexadiene-1,4-diol dehydrogenase [Paenibacillus montaniterrae]|uniref:2,5-dichloro-2,5-cyclohexadiene-1,4-diol dehydrogenase n=1 Tax=Paenibacillus montaniterrae TaxID=429341 RepID=A0A919YLM7_9BACL|nr:glucose 1-dehydrogenase [Paenibacillus montaniterrae]GIP16153.1 2,5-dichloro-2,5-cyclohexadiene-1,4-diol dehydrogenase [Paenibacillus montaniterrae]